jgi:hypothetical protein
MKFNEDAVRDLIKTVLEECRKLQVEAYESAGISGLCEEGRWEAARDAAKGVDIEKLIQDAYARQRAP